MIAWFDTSVGAAGDMLLAALLDAGANVDVVREALQTLDLGDWSLTPTEVQRGVFRALYAEVRVDGHVGDDDHHHAHAHAHHHGHDHHHEHAHYADLRRGIADAALPPRAKARALAVFDALAHAEAKLHGTTVEDVVLHEVGGKDALIDIVGTCVALEDLGVDRIVATPLPMGTGHTHGAHGRIPLPAPATLALCEGWPVVPSPWPGEWVTPTGAALITALATPGAPPAMTVRATGHGAGRKDPDFVANVVRVVIGDAHGRSDRVVELACNLDDVVAEHVPPLVEGLLAAGAVDAWTTAIAMKKGRPGLTVHALAREDVADAVAEHLLRHSTTLGVRRQVWDRTVLDRWVDTVETPWGPVHIKVGGRGGDAWHASPEFDDVDALARANGVPHRTVHETALATWRRP